jgi:phosphonopyruvate decarboxylase
MGHASSIALGIALALPERRILCLDGDGAALMHLGALGTIATQAPKNYLHVVLNNGAHDSVGGQPTIACAIDLCAIARAAGYKSAAAVTSAADITSAVNDFAHAPERGPRFLEIRVKKGNRADLGRPTASPAENKEVFMSFLQGSLAP